MFNRKNAKRDEVIDSPERTVAAADPAHEERAVVASDQADRGSNRDTMTYADRPDAAHFDAKSERHTTAVAAERDLKWRREEFGGLKGGAIFYGWLVAIALSILLVGIVSAIATAVGSSLDVTKAQAELRAGTIGVAAAIAFVAILALGYLAGGYVAGRLARFSGAAQGFGVWVLGLLITVIVVGVGAAFGDKYNVFERVDLPSFPIRADDVTAGGMIAVGAVLLATLITAILGGMMGQRYHTRIDRATI